MILYRGSRASSASYYRYSNLTPIPFLVASILIAVDAKPLPQTSLSRNSFNTNGEYTPDLYPGQKGFYEPDIDSSLLAKTDNLPSDIDGVAKYVTKPSGGFSELASNSIENNAQPLPPNQNTVPISGVSDTPIPDYNSNGREIQQSQQPDTPKKSEDLALSTQAGNKEMNPVNSDDGATHTTHTYQQYGGDGSLNAGWPDKTKWVSFEDMFDFNSDTMSRACSYWGVPENSASETQTMKQSIKDLARQTHVDERMILAIIMQESKGCVRIDSTSYGVRNPGLMQSYNGDGTCNENGKVKTPCPSSMITKMISDGTAGTSSGPGLVSILSKIPGEDASVYYKAARIYNSGSIDKSGDLGRGIAVHCFASDIANRLTGWAEGIGAKGSGCNLDSSP